MFAVGIGARLPALAAARKKALQGCCADTRLAELTSGPGCRCETFDNITSVLGSFTDT